MKYVTGPVAIREISTIWIPMPDGVRLATRIWLPTDAETRPVPALLEAHPYRLRDRTRVPDTLNHAYFASHGYASVRLDTRGSGDSEGVLEDEYLPQEQEDILAVIAWLAQQPWCDGAVGMFGISWGGFNTLQVAARRPPALKAAIVVGATDDRYATDVHYEGGCLLGVNPWWSGIMFALNALPPDPAVVGDSWRETWFARLEANRPWIVPWLQHSLRDEYWRQGSVCEDFSRIAIPVYAISGWDDRYAEAVPRLLGGLTSPHLGLVGPWDHAYPHTPVTGPAIGFLQESLRWWDYWLKDVDTGIISEPMLRSWMRAPGPAGGHWVAEASWPAPTIEPRTLFLSVDSLTEAPPHPGAIAVRSVVGADEQPGEPLFLSAPLRERCELLGAPRLDIELSCDQPGAHLLAFIDDVAPDGTVTRVTEGCLELTHTPDHTTRHPLIPGRPFPVTLELDDTAYSLERDHRVRLRLATEDWPRIWPSPVPATLTAALGVSRLVLPTRTDTSLDASLPPFPEPEAAPPGPYTWVQKADSSTEATLRDEITGRVVTTSIGHAPVRRLDDIGVAVELVSRTEYEIIESDPTSAEIRTNVTATIERASGIICVDAATSVTRPAGVFVVHARLHAYEDGVLTFERATETSIPDR